VTESELDRQEIEMKHLIDTTQLEPKNNPTKQQELVEFIWNETNWSYIPKNAYIAKTYTQEQVIKADGIARAIAENSPIHSIDFFDILENSRDEIQVMFEAKLARCNKTAGARALKRKYGKASARRIIQSHSK